MILDLFWAKRKYTYTTSNVLNTFLILCTLYFRINWRLIDILVPCVSTSKIHLMEYFKTTHHNKWKCTWFSPWRNVLRLTLILTHLSWQILLCFKSYIQYYSNRVYYIYLFRIIKEYILYIVTYCFMKKYETKCKSFNNTTITWRIVFLALFVTSKKK